MTTPEEAKVLGYLRRHPTANLTDLIHACLPGTPRQWGERIIANLEWLGYVTVYPTGDGGAPALQITERGLRGVRR